MLTIRILMLSALIAMTQAFGSMRAMRTHRFGQSTALNANIVETATNAGTFNTLVAAIKAAGLADTLSSGFYTVFAPNDAAFAKLPAGTVDALLKDIPKLKNILLYHVHPGKMSPTRNGRTMDTLCVSEDGFPKQLTVKVTNWSCESFIWGGQESPAPVVAQDIKCDNGLIHVVGEVLMPYVGNEPPKITFIGKGDLTGTKTLQTGYYGDEEARKGKDLTYGYNKDGKFDTIKAGDAWIEAGWWDKNDPRILTSMQKKEQEEAANK